MMLKLRSGYKRIKTMLPLIILLITLLSVTTDAASPLYQHSASVTTLALREDFDYEIPLSQPFRFYGEDKTKVFIYENGFVSFDGASATNPITDAIGPFYSDVVGNNEENLSYETFDDIAIIQQTTAHIESIAGDVFVPTFVFVVTWENVTEFSGDPLQENTFQVVLATDGSKSYVLFLYEKLNWGDTGSIFVLSSIVDTDYIVCGDGTPALLEMPSNSQNVCGTAGVLVFRVDQTTWTGADQCIPVYTQAECAASRNANRDLRCKARRK